MKLTSCGKRFVVAVAVAPAVVVIVICPGCGSKQPAAKTAAKALPQSATETPAAAEKAAAQKPAELAANRQPSTAAAVKPLGSSKLLRLPLASRDSLNIIPLQVVGRGSDHTLRVKLGDAPRDVERVWKKFAEAFRRSVRESGGQSAALIGSPTPDLEKFFRGFMTGSLTTQQVEQMKLVHVQVQKLDEQGQGVILLSSAVLTDMEPGSTVFLLRPQPELKAVPKMLPVADARSAQQAKPAPDQIAMRTSINNLKQIGLAMHNFSNAHGYFPPAVVHGPDGKPWHSWRVLLLPFVGQAHLYEQYRFDEPWDGPNNKQLIQQVPSVYRDPIHGDTRDGYTHYAVAVGAGTAFPREGYKLPANPPRKLALPKRERRSRQGVPGTTTFADFRDGTSNSVLVGPVSPERKIPWTKPEDIVFDEHFPGLGKPGGFAAPYKTDQGAGGVFVYADGSPHAISDRIDLHVLSCLVHIADQQRISWDDVPTIPTPGGPPRAMPVLELKLGGPEPSARLVLEPVAELSRQSGSGAQRHSAGQLPLPLERPVNDSPEWTCPTHPRITLSRPGKCPFCARDLIRKTPQGPIKPPKG